jgi:polar amino acid transport system substrate-binding protein
MNSTPVRVNDRMRFLVLCLLLTFALSGGAVALAGSSFDDLPEQATPIPTLVPPTPLPARDDRISAGIPTESRIAQIVRDGVVRVGILYNEAPFGVFNSQGEASGFDADLARAIAEAWGVTVEFVQVTRQTNIEMVEAGVIDLLIGAQPHQRELDTRIEFSQSYYPSAQVMLVREGDGATVLEHMADRQVGVIVGTRGEAAVEAWRARASGYTFNVQRFYTLDEALGALDESRVDAVVENRVRLTARLVPGRHRFVGVPVQPEPYAIGMRRQDFYLRLLVDRTLQWLYLNGRLNEIHQQHFNGEAYPGAAFVIWDNVGSDAPRAATTPTDVPIPAQLTLPRLRQDRALRVAGLRSLSADAPESDRRVDALNRALVNAIAARWGVNVVPVPEEGRSPYALIEAGAADLVVGADPDWAYVGQVDFTTHYLVRGFRLMTRRADRVGGFGDLRGRIIGVFQADTSARELVQRVAERERAILGNFFTILREQDAGFTLLVDNNAYVVFGDSIRMMPSLEAYPDQLMLTTNAAGQPLWYTRDFLGFAVPRNDLDFKLLLEYTLQDLYRDGTLGELLRPVMLSGETPQLEVWSGRGALETALAAG